MSRSTRLRALMALTTTLLLVTGIFSAPAKAEGTPPPPEKVDRCGLAQDQFVVDDNDYDYYADPYWNDWYEPGKPYSTDGQLTVTIYADDYSGAGMQTLVLDFTNEPCTDPEAPNRGWAVVGECFSDTSLTDVVLFFKNVDDMSDHYIDEVEVLAQSTSGYGSDTELIGRVYDGQVRSVRVGERLAQQLGDDYLGLPPGQYTARFYRDGNYGNVIVTTTFFVPACGGEEPPPVLSRKARGSLSLVRCNKVKVVANAVDYTKTPRVLYRVVKFKAGAPRTATVRNFTVLADTRKVTFVKARPRVRTVVILKVKRPSSVWNVLDRVRTRRC